jgi:hypothetical protein
MTCRTGQLQDLQNGTARLGQAEQNRQNKTAKTGLWDRAARTGLSEQVARTGLPAQGC